MRQVFEVGAPRKEAVGGLAKRGAAWSLVMHVGTQVAGLVATVFLSRILAPGDFGILAMATTFTALLQLFSDFGLSWATIQKKDLTSEQVNNLFWLNTVAGFALLGLTLLAAPTLAKFYGEPKLQLVISVLGSSFVLAGIAAQPTALIKRQMQFKQFALIVLSSAMLGTGGGIVAAVAGAGYWALVVQVLATQISRTIMVVWYSGYRGGFIARGAGTSALIGFGGSVSLASIGIYLARNADKILIGRAAGSEDLGFYTRAVFLATLPAFLASSVMTHVMVPYLSAIKHDAEAMSNGFRRALETSVALSFPLLMGMVVLAPSAVRLVYGNSWQPVVPLLMWLSIAGLFQPLYDAATWLFISNGLGKVYAACAVAGSSALTAGFLVGVQYGSTGVAIVSAILWPFAMALPSLIVSHRKIGMSIGSTLGVIGVPLAASVFMSLVMFIFGTLLEAASIHWLTVTGAQIVIGLTSYLVIMKKFWKPLAGVNVLRLTQRLRLKGSRR